MPTMWVVDEYMDKLTRMASSKATSTFMNSDRYPNRFETEREASKFIINRAHAKRDIAAGELKRAEDRIKRVTKKFGEATA